MGIILTPWIRALNGTNIIELLIITLNELTPEISIVDIGNYALLRMDLKLVKM